MSEKIADNPNRDQPQGDAQLLAMQHEFDLGFAQLSNAKTVVPENYLGLRFGDDAYAIRVAAIAGLHVDRRIMPLLSPVSSLLGVVGFRGLIAPVFDLATLLGYVRKGTPRWMILVKIGEPVALAFDHFEAHFSAGPNDIFSAPQLLAASPTMLPDSARAHLFDAVRIDGVIRPIIQMQSLLELIQQPHNTSIRHRSKSS